MKGSDDVGLNKISGAMDGTIHMAFRRKIDDSARAMFGKQFANQLRVADVAAHKDVARIILERCEIFQIARIGQLIQINHSLIVLREPVEDEIRTNKACATSH